MPHNQPPISADWYQLSFDALYPVVYAHRTVEAAERESLFSIEQTHLQPHDRVLDLCCGSGRHMAHLTRACEHVVGLDYSPHLLEIARNSLDDRASFVRADMRDQPFKGTFDVVMNYFTSFGYFPTEEENRRVVDSVCQALKPDGRFFIDYMSKSFALENMEPETRRTVEDFDIVEKRWVDPKKQRINKRTIVYRDGEEINQSGESVQLYTQDEFAALLSGGCLAIDAMYGNYGGEAVGDDQPRMIAIGKKVR
jgi:SAM-dependent methyltransferase